MLSQKETQNIKNQLIGHINSNLPENQKESAIEQINSMDSEQIEEFVKKNKMFNEKDGKCIFCSIVSEEIESVRLDENEEAIAVLEINPVARGHILIIPREHVSSEEDIPQGAFELSKILSEKIKKLKPKKIDVIPSKMFGHEILNIIPVYKNENLNSKRSSAKKEELEELRDIIYRKEKEVIKKPKPKELAEKNLWIPKRIP